MSEAVPDCSIQKILLVVSFLLCVGVGAGYSQTSGDIAFTGYNGDNNEFAFVSFVPISSGTTIYFTDAPWEGGKQFESDKEGRVTYRVPSGGISAGEIVEINPNKHTSSNGGTVVETEFDFDGSGDEIYAFLGADENTPKTFLSAITNKPSWSSAEGQIPADLTKGVTALSGIGRRTSDNASYIGSRKGSVSTLKSDLRKVDANWNTTDGKGNQNIAFQTESFSLVDLPTVAFSSGSFSGDEGATVNLTVTLVESNNTAVDVKVVFLGNISSADASDIGNFVSETVHFSDSDPTGTTKNVRLNLNADGNFEGAEKAVFQLQKQNAGTIIEPNVATLTIKDADAPDVVINEFLTDPVNTDAAGINEEMNRERSDRKGSNEFVEIVNNETFDIDISGWKLSDDGGSSTIYTFPSATVLPAGYAIVVSGSEKSTDNFGGAIVQTYPNLILSDSGGEMMLLDNNDNVIQDIPYGGPGQPAPKNGESVVRSPELTGNFENYSAVSGNDGSLFSPGTKMDGTPFGAKHAFGIRGTEGWRMIASPVQDATFDDFLNKFWMQGVVGSDDPNGEGTLFSWDESAGGRFVAPAQMSGVPGTMKPGKGYIVYLFEDDDSNSPGIQGGFPKLLNTDKSENTGTVSVEVSAHDTDGSGNIDGSEGWNLLGNPFDANLSVTEVLAALKNADPNLDDKVYVWDADKGAKNGGFRVLTEGDVIAPFQAFFVRFNTDGVDATVDFNKNSLEVEKDKEFYKIDEPAFSFDLELHGDQYYDTYNVEFNDKGSTDLDSYDAYKLLSLNVNSINLFSSLSGNKLQKNVLPKNLESTIEVPLYFDAAEQSSLTFRWNNIESIPNDWNVVLIDKALNREINLKSDEEYNFSITVPQEKLNGSLTDKELLNKQKDDYDARFILSIQPKPKKTNEARLPESVKLNPNYPNPFNPTTTISYELTQKSNVVLSVWNMIGQKVATLVDGVVEAGSHEQTWNASNMPSGIYIARFEVDGKVFTRKMTLIK